MPAVRFFCLVVAASVLTTTWSAVKDLPFKQDISIKYTSSSDLSNATYYKLVVARNGVVFVLTDRGVARDFGSSLAIDRSFRGLSARKPVDIASHSGEVVYLYDDQLL